MRSVHAIKIFFQNKNFFKNNFPFLLILFLGIFLRVYKPIGWFSYGHDQDLAGWIIKDILLNKHIRLIGQETTSQGVFIGPLFYYLQIPFFILTKMQPTGSLILTNILSAFSIFSYYFCFSKIFNQKVGILASLIYAVSNLTTFTDRVTVPTMPVMLWSVWFFYALWLLLKGKQKAYLLIGVLLGLVWHLNLALAILAPLVILSQILSRRKIKFKYLFWGITMFLVLMMPFIIFEIRHGFRQVGAIYSSLITQKDYVPGTGVGIAKLDRVMQLTHKNISGIFLGRNSPLPYSWSFYFLVFAFIILLYKKRIDWKLSLIFFLWIFGYILFFALNPINISEYYLNGMNVIWIAIVSVLMATDDLKFLAVILIASNLYGFFSYQPGGMGYLERRNLVSFIKEDAARHNYPCISVSYITSPGYEFGYRYLFFLENLHVNAPSSGAPVYTIVFPHRKVGRIDKSFEALALVFPDYERYQEESVKKSCSGENSNLTDPMFGYTQ